MIKKNSFNALFDWKTSVAYTKDINGTFIYEVYTFIYGLSSKSRINLIKKIFGVLKVYPDGTKHFISNSWYVDINTDNL